MCTCVYGIETPGKAKKDNQQPGMSVSRRQNLHIPGDEASTIWKYYCTCTCLPHKLDRLCLSSHVELDCTVDLFFKKHWMFFCLPKVGMKGHYSKLTVEKEACMTFWPPAIAHGLGNRCTIRTLSVFASNVPYVESLKTTERPTERPKVNLEPPRVAGRRTRMSGSPGLCHF